jgi:hypothetical protein
MLLKHVNVGGHVHYRDLLPALQRGLAPRVPPEGAITSGPGPSAADDVLHSALLPVGRDASSYPGPGLGPAAQEVDPAAWQQMGQQQGPWPDASAPSSATSSALPSTSSLLTPVSPVNITNDSLRQELEVREITASRGRALPQIDPLRHTGDQGASPASSEGCPRLSMTMGEAHRRQPGSGGMAGT